MRGQMKAACSFSLTQLFVSSVTCQSSSLQLMLKEKKNMSVLLCGSSTSFFFTHQPPRPALSQPLTSSSFLFSFCFS